MEQTLNSTPKWIWIVNLAIALFSAVISMLMKAFEITLFALIVLFVINLIILVLKFVKKYRIDATYPFIFTILMYLSMPLSELVLFSSYSYDRILAYNFLIYSIYTGSKLFMKNE